MRSGSPAQLFVSFCSVLSLVDGSAFPRVKRSAANPYAPYPTTCPEGPLIRAADGLSEKEQAYVAGRSEKASQALFEWLIKTWGCPYVEPTDLPVIAIAMSGMYFRVVLCHTC